MSFLLTDIPSKFPKMIPNGYLIFEDESFLDSTVAKMNALRKSGQFCDVRLQVWFNTNTAVYITHTHLLHFQRSHCTEVTKSPQRIKMFDNTKQFETHKMLVLAKLICLVKERGHVGPRGWE